MCVFRISGWSKQFVQCGWAAVGSFKYMTGFFDMTKYLRKIGLDSYKIDRLMVCGRGLWNDSSFKRDRFGKFELGTPY